MSIIWCPNCNYVFRKRSSEAEFECPKCKVKLRLVKKNNDFEVEVLK